MTFAEMQSSVRRKLDEAHSTFWTDQDIKDAINDAHAELSDDSEFYERWAVVPLLQGRMYYDLSLILPDSFLSPRRCWSTATRTWLEPSDAPRLDRSLSQWELTTGNPEKYWLRGNWWLGVWPKPAQDGNGVRLYFTGIPPQMTEVTDTPLFPREFHQAIIDAALSDLLAQERETKKALGYWKSFAGYSERLTAYVQERTSLDRMDVM